MALNELQLQTRFVGNPLDHEADPTGLSDSRDALAGAEGLYQACSLPPGTYRVTSNLDLEQAWTLQHGAIIRPDAGVTVTFRGPFQGNGYHFDESDGGHVTFAAGAVDALDTAWWGLGSDPDEDVSAKLEELSVTAVSLVVPLRLARATHRISTGFLLYADLQPRPGALISVDSGQFLTLLGQLQHPLVRLFAGDGDVGFSRQQHEINAEWWTTNLVPGVTDMAAGLQAAIDAAPDRSGALIPIRAYGIASQITLFDKALTLRGTGWGRSGQPYGSYLKWQGAAGGVMVRAENCQGLYMGQFRFIGNSLARPAKMLEFWQSASSGVGQDYNTFEMLWFGRAAWDSSADYDYQMERGISIDGDFGGNDSNVWRMIVIQAPYLHGVEITNSQYLIQHFEHLYVWYARFFGIKTKANISLHNCFFAHNGDATNSGQDGGDFCTYDSSERPSITALSFGSESSGRLIKFQSTGTLAIYSGYWQPRDGFINPDLRVIDGLNPYANVVRLHDFDLLAYPGYAGGTPLITLRNINPGTGRNVLIVSGSCVNITAASVDMNTASAAGNEAFISFQTFSNGGSPFEIFQNHLGPNQTVDPTRYDIPGRLKANVEAVTAATFTNGWTDYDPGAYQGAGFYKDGMGRVHLQGLIRSGVIGQSAFTLPAGYRPALDRIFGTDSNGAHGQLIIRATGLVIPNAGVNTTFALDGISFPAA